MLLFTDGKTFDYSAASFYYFIALLRNAILSEIISIHVCLHNRHKGVYVPVI